MKWIRVCGQSDASPHVVLVGPLDLLLLLLQIVAPLLSPEDTSGRSVPPVARSSPSEGRFEAGGCLIFSRGGSQSSRSRCLPASCSLSTCSERRSLNFYSIWSVDEQRCSWKKPETHNSSGLCLKYVKLLYPPPPLPFFLTPLPTHLIETTALPASIPLSPHPPDLSALLQQLLSAHAFHRSYPGHVAPPLISPRCSGGWELCVRGQFEAVGLISWGSGELKTRGEGSSDRLLVCFWYCGEEERLRLKHSSLSVWFGCRTLIKAQTFVRSFVLFLRDKTHLNEYLTGLPLLD